MANPTSRDTLIDYCKRRLGDPVLEINVDEDQIDDRIDEAIQYWQEYNSDAVFRTYVAHQITADDVTNKYITLDTDVLYIVKMFGVSNTTTSSVNFFDIKYQMMLNDIANMQNYVGDLAYYHQLQQYLSLLDMELNGVPQTTYTRHQNRLYIHGEFQAQDIKEGDYIVYEAYKKIPTNNTNIWNDMWLKAYSAALIKEQWGMNLIKFEGMQLPGGVVMNGRQLYDDALTEKEDLKEKIRLEHELPPDFFIG